MFEHCFCWESFVTQVALIYAISCIAQVRVLCIIMLPHSRAACPILLGVTTFKCTIISSINGIFSPGWFHSWGWDTVTIPLMPRKVFHTFVTPCTLFADKSKSFGIPILMERIVIYHQLLVIFINLVS